MKTQEIPQTFAKFFGKNGIHTGASIWYTPILIAILLLCKGIYFNLNRDFKELTNNIRSEHSIQSSLALEFAKNQNHKKILDLQEKYFPHYISISAENIIAENQIETLGVTKNVEK